MADGPDSVTPSQDPNAVTPNAGDGAANNRSPAPEVDSFFDRSKLPPELIPAFNELQGKYSKAKGQLSQKEKLADQMAAIMRDPVAARAAFEEIARYHGRTDLLAPLPGAQAQPESDEPPEEVRNDWGKFGKWIADKSAKESQARVADLERRFAADLARKDEELMSLKVQTQRSSYPLSEKYEVEIKDAMARYKLPFEKAYDMVTVAEREGLAKQRAREDTERDMAGRFGAYTERPGSSKAASLPPVKPGMSLAEIYANTPDPDS